MEIKNLAQKKHFFDQLNERERRHYAAIESQTIGFGGQKIISECFGIEADTIRRGIYELENGDILPATQIRKKGGGRKKKSLNNLSC